MAKVKINDKDYEYDELSDSSKAQVNSLRFVQTEIVRLQAQIGVYKTAEAAYGRALQNELEEG